MKNFLLLILFLFITCRSFAGVFYYGTGEAVNLEDKIRMEQSDLSILTGSATPSITSTDAERGSIYLNDQGFLFIKKDAGDSTLWARNLDTNSVLNDLFDVDATTDLATGSALSYDGSSWKLENNHASMVTVAGQSKEQHSVTLVTSGGDIFADVEKTGTGDVDYFLTNGSDLSLYTLDCTTGAGVGGKARIQLNEGTDTVPVINYVYVTVLSAPATYGGKGTAQLNVSTTIPTGNFAWVGRYTIGSDTFQASDGAYTNQRYDDAVSRDSRGSNSYAREKLRALGAVHSSGTVGAVAVTTNVGTPDNVLVSVSSGKVYQMHRQTISAVSSPASMYVANDSATFYDEITDLNVLLTDSDGDTMSSRRFNLVLWGSAGSGSDNKLFINLPNGSYNNNSQAIVDQKNTANMTVPIAFSQTAYLIARIVLRHRTTSGGTWEILENENITGIPVGVRSAGSGSSGNEFVDDTFRIVDNTDEDKEMAFEVSGVTTGNVRTTTVQDMDGTMALLESAQTFTATNSFDQDIILTNSTNANPYGMIYKDSVPWLHDFTYGNNGTVTTVGFNVFIGGAGNLTMGSAATSVNHASYNVGIGELTFDNATNAQNSIGIGYGALEATTYGWSNVSIGYRAGNASTGGSNTIVGANAGENCGVANSSTMIGQNASRFGDGDNNVAVGVNALYNADTDYNIGIGSSAGRYIAAGGSNTASVNSLFLGYDTRPALAAQTNETVIGYAAIGNGSNTTTIGNSSNTDNYFTGRIHGESLDITDSATISGSLTVSSTALITDDATFSNRLSIGTTLSLVAAQSINEPSYLLAMEGNEVYKMDESIKANDDDVVHDTGNETVAGIKTFSSFPITPSSAPTTDYQVSNKKYVDDNGGGGKKQVYSVVQTGASMTTRSGDGLGFNLGTADIISDGDSLITVANTSNRTRFTASEKLYVQFNWGGGPEISGHTIYVKRYNSSSSLQETIYGTANYANQELVSASHSFLMQSGDYLFICTTSGYDIYGQVRASFIAFND